MSYKATVIVDGNARQPGIFETRRQAQAFKMRWLSPGTYRNNHDIKVEIEENRPDVQDLIKDCREAVLCDHGVDD